jgi:hypothetical protein
MVRATELTQAYRYRIDGIGAPAERRWHYIGVLDGAARFLDNAATAVMLEVDRLVVIGPAHLEFEAE